MIRVALKSSALGAVFVSGLVAGVALHADLGPTKRLVARTANGALANVFEGRLVIGTIRTLSLGSRARVHVTDVTMHDPDDREVLHVRDVKTELDLGALIRSLTFGKSTKISIPSVNVADVDTLLDVDARGLPTLARAFAARKSSEPSSPPPPRSGDGVQLEIARAKLDHVRLHGNLVPPSLLADLNGTAATIAIDRNILTITIAQSRATVDAPRAPSQQGPLEGLLRGELVVPLREGQPKLDVKLEDGDLAGIPFLARASLDGGHLDAALDTPEVAPDVVRRAFPTSPLAAPAEIHVAAEGVLPDLAVTARARAGKGELRARGGIGLADRRSFRVDTDISNIDAGAVGGPSTEISGAAHVEGELGGGAPAGRFSVHTKPGVAAGERTPATDVDGTFDARGVSAKLHASEPGLEVDGKVDLPAPHDTLSFDVRARSNDLRSIARAPGVVVGSAAVQATGRIDLGRRTIVGHVEAQGRDVGKDAVRSSKLDAHASIAGQLDAPVLDVTVDAEDIALSAEGKRPLVYPRLRARAHVNLLPTPTITDAEVRVEASAERRVEANDHAGADASIVARADEIRLDENGAVTVRGGRITGLGEPIEVEAHTRGGGISIRAHGADLDMQRAATMTGIEELRSLPAGARASVDVDLTSGVHTEGHVDLVVRAEGGYAGEVHAAIKDAHVSARARVDAGALGWVEVRGAELDLPGPLSAKTIARATGSADVSGQIDLAQGAALFGGESLEDVSGTLAFAGRVERGDAPHFPRISLSARTRDLVVALAARQRPDGSSERTSIAGADALFHVAYDGATDDTEISAVTWDKAGVLASADAKSRVPVAGWVTGARPFDRAAIAHLAGGAVVDVPQRAVADVPIVLERPDLRGTLSAHVEMTGTIAEPHVSLLARTDDLREAGRARDDARHAPVDARLEARWDGDRVVATLGVDERDHRRGRADESPHARNGGHVRGLVLGRVDTRALLTSGDMPWNASAELDVKDMELAPLPIPTRVSGMLTSRIRLRDLNGTPSLAADARVVDLSVANVPVGRGEVKIDARHESLAINVAIRQDKGGDAQFDVASRALLWHGTSIDWAKGRETKVEYTASGLRLAMLRPLVRRQIPEMDGRIDGAGSAIVDADHQVFEGGLALSDGRMYVSAIGEELTNVNAIARFERNGVFRIQDAHGRIGPGEFKASATGRMNGLRFGSAEATIVIPSKQGVPLSSEGATFAEATGEVRIAAKMSDDRKQLLVAVAIPRARVEVPDRSTQQLQSLEPDPAIAIGVRRADGTLAPESRASRREGATAAKPSDRVLARFAVTLGDDVLLEGRGASIYLTGRTLVDIAQEVAVTGQISLKSGGTIKVQGRKFVVDRGTVTFGDSDDPTNPVVVAAAYWDAPDRTRIWVEYSGPLKTTKQALKIRSEPPYSQNEIFSILLFGRPDPNAAAGGSKGTGEAAANAVGGGLAAAGLNKALGELNDDLDLEQDRTSTNRMRTKVGYRLRRNLKVQLGYASATLREPDTTFLFLEWQFAPKWSLIGTRGDRGTSILDMLFQHRY